MPKLNVGIENQVRALVGAGHRVITSDRRGFGASSQPSRRSRRLDQRNLEVTKWTRVY